MKNTKAAAENEQDPNEWFSTTIAFLVVALCFILPLLGIWSLTPNFIKYPLLYGAIYQVRLNHVIVDKKPTDCQWEHAPIGDKDCHYKKTVAIGHDENGRAEAVYITWEKTDD